VTHGIRPYLVLAALVAGVYGQTLAFDFTYFDDDRLVLADQAFLREPANVRRAFPRDVFRSVSPTCRPLLTLSFMVDAQAGGGAPFVYHLTNVVLHALATLAVFGVLLALGSPRAPSLVASALFAGVSIVHARQFRDGVTFWSGAVRDAPRSADARHGLGYVLQRRGDLEAPRRPIGRRSSSSRRTRARRRSTT
jgi:hypothetical protein